MARSIASYSRSLGDGPLYLPEELAVRLIYCDLPWTLKPPPAGEINSVQEKENKSDARD